MWLDVVELVRQLRPKDTVTAVHYFSAIVKNEPAAVRNQTGYIEAMKIRNGTLLAVHLGDSRSGRSKTAAAAVRATAAAAGGPTEATRRREPTSPSAR